MRDKSMKTPILMLVFNRLETTKRVFEAIKRAKPEKLYIACDGAREFRDGEFEKVKEVREYILANVNWECEVKTLFQEKNLGCKFAPIAGVNWLLENEEYGIILEDDCLPHEDFFKLCEELLEKYKSNEKIFAISGTNIDVITNIDSDYFYSLMGGNWGWATWKRAWKNYQSDISCLLTEENWEIIKKNLNDNRMYKVLKHHLKNSVDSMNNDAWDYQWLFIRLLNNGLSIVPSKNLISNIGFGEDSTHTVDENSPFSRLGTNSLNWPLKCPEIEVPNRRYDDLFYKHFSPSILLRLINKVKRIIKW